MPNQPTTFPTPPCTPAVAQPAGSSSSSKTLHFALSTDSTIAAGKNKRGNFDINFYGWTEFIALILYLAGGIAFLVIAIQTFQSGFKDAISPAAGRWKKAAEAYAVDAGPAISDSTSSSAWTGTVATTAPSSPIVNQNFGLMSQPIGVHYWVPQFTSYFLKATLDVSTLLSTSPVNNKVSLQLNTDVNSLQVDIEMNFTDINHSMSIAQNCGGDTGCNKTDKCITSYGALSTVKQASPSSAEWECETPYHNQANCLIVFKRRNDTGVNIWWPDFDLKGCRNPFSASEYLQADTIRTSNEIDFFVYEKHDPAVQKQILQEIPKGKISDSFVADRFKIAEKTIVERKDPIPEGVGLMFLASLLLIGSMMMCSTLFPFWYRRYKNGQNLMGPVVVEESSSTSTSSADEEKKQMVDSSQGEGDEGDEELKEKTKVTTE